MKQLFALVAKHFNINEEDVSLSHISISNEGTGAIKLYVGAYLTLSNCPKIKYVTCSLHNPASFHCSNDDKIFYKKQPNIIFIDELNDIKSQLGIFSEDSFCDWIPIDFFIRNNITLDNPFNSYRFIMNTDGVFDGKKYTKGDLIIYCPYLLISEKIDYNHVDYVKVSP